MRSPTERFSDRVDTYGKYRPTYPVDAVAHLAAEMALTEESVVADVGSGTGIFAGLLADRGARVIAVEPNPLMRAAASAALAKRGRVAFVDGTAERTGLPGGSVDLVTAAQAFHWFDRDAAKRDFARILKPRGAVALIWNRRRADHGFLAEYERILREEIPEYAEVSHANVTEGILREFMPIDFRVARFDFHQTFTKEGMLGRFQSSSYSPPADSERYAEIGRRLIEAFDAHAESGNIRFDYQTELYTGRFA